MQQLQLFASTVTELPAPRPRELLRNLYTFLPAELIHEGTGAAFYSSARRPPTNAVGQQLLCGDGAGTGGDVDGQIAKPIQSFESHMTLKHAWGFDMPLPEPR